MGDRLRSVRLGSAGGKFSSITGNVATCERERDKCYWIGSRLPQTSSEKRALLVSTTGHFVVGHYERCKQLARTTNEMSADEMIRLSNAESMFIITNYKSQTGNKIKANLLLATFLVTSASLLSCCQAGSQERQVVATSTRASATNWTSASTKQSKSVPLARQVQYAGLLSAESSEKAPTGKRATFSNGSLVGNNVASVLAVLADEQQSKQISARTGLLALTSNDRYKQPISKRETHNIAVYDTHQQPLQQLQRPLKTIHKRQSEDVCVERLCFGLPTGCLTAGSQSAAAAALRPPGSSLNRQLGNLNTAYPSPSTELGGSLCSVLVTSKQFIDPYRPGSRDILFELIALPGPNVNNYAAVGFSENGRMQGFVSECIQVRDSKTKLQIILLRHSYNIPGAYRNVPATVISGIKNLGVTNEEGYYQCRWIVESSVEFTYEALNGTSITKQEDLGYKNYHILLASGEYDPTTNGSVSKMTSILLRHKDSIVMTIM